MDLRYFAIFLIFILGACINKTNNTERLVSHFIKQQEQRVCSLQKKTNEVLWRAYISHANRDSLSYYYLTIQQCEETLQELKSGMDHLYMDVSSYKFLEGVKASGAVQDIVLKRQVDKIMQLYKDARLGFDSLEMVRAQFMEQQFSGCPVHVDLPNWRQSDSLFNRYKVHIGHIHKELERLVQAYNACAQKEGKRNYHEFLMDRYRILPINYQNLLRDIERGTRADYLQLKASVEKFWRDSLGVSPSEMNVFQYNYCFCQLKKPVNWNVHYTGDELLGYAETFWRCIGLPMKELGSRMMLVDNDEEKRQTVVLNCDNYGDIRGYYNIPFSPQGLQLLIQESAYINSLLAVDETVPYFLREPDEVLSESVTAFYPNIFFQSDEIRNRMQLPKPEYAIDVEFANPWFLFQIRNLLVMVEMEQEIYSNPDQDLTRLFWSKVEKYLFIEIPEQFRHMEWVKNEGMLTLNGANLLNLYGMVLAAQYYHESKENSAFIKELPQHLFSEGGCNNWQDAVEKVCGEKLNAKYLSDFYK